MEFDDDYGSLIPEEKSPSPNRGLKLKSLKKDADDEPALVVTKLEPHAPTGHAEERADDVDSRVRVGEGGGKGSWVRVRVRKEMLSMRRGKKREVMVSGKVTYNGHEMNEFEPQRTTTYISQHDVHIGELSVRETLSYSARFQGVGDCYAELSRREKEANIKPDHDLDLFMKAGAGEGQEESVITDYMLKFFSHRCSMKSSVVESHWRGTFLVFGVVIFRDFKTSNVLLDEDFQPRLSDFGLAREGPIPGHTHISTAVVGTHGYAAPDYIATGHLNAKSDVWSFGVLMLSLHPSELGFNGLNLVSYVALCT
ncbi:hypothetical protein Droror1_Dr00024459 [Drosera rotundifolia]